MRKWIFGGFAEFGTWQVKGFGLSGEIDVGERMC